MPSAVHTHGARPGAARARKRDYAAFLREFCRRGGIGCDAGGMNLELSDEDARYATDAEPGVYDKLACLQWLWRGWPERDTVDIWDLYAAPGMDVVYSALAAGMGLGASVRVTGVSIVRDAEDRERFGRMRANARTAEETVGSACSVRLVESSAQDFCKGYAGAPADVAIVSMPWMTSMGELHGASEGQLRAAEDMMREARELLGSLERARRPRIVSLMVPFGAEAVALEGYGLCETVRARKWSASQGREISEYCVHVLGLGMPDARKFTVFDYWV